MTKKLFPVSVVGILVMALLTQGGGNANNALATHGNLNVHVHDDFYHPAGAFGTPTDHTVAMAACMVANPDPACDAQIHAGDTITWVTAAPQAANPHTVTECTDNSFATCGAAVDAANPIGDSGIRQPAPAVPPTGWPYGPVTFSTEGTYYYRCDIHPDVMRGRIVVVAAVQTATPTPTPSLSPTPTLAPTTAGTATPTPTTTPASVPPTGGAGADGGWTLSLLVVLSTLTGVLLLAGATGLLVTKRR